MKRATLALLTLIAAGAAQAQERPPVAPTRDVLVTYRATPPSAAGARPGAGVGTGPGAAGVPQAPQTIRVAATQGGRLLRVEGMGAGGVYVIVDRTTQRMVMVLPQDLRYVEMPANDAFARGFVLNDGMTFAKRGTDTVAGLKCTVWDVTSRDGAGTACITEDGVLLRGRGNDGKGGIEATAVKYGPQPASMFRPPADFSRLDVPPGLGGAARPQGR